MSGRRLLAAAGAALFALLLVATPASAAEPTVEWTRPTADDPVLKENAPIAATISTEKDNQEITKVEFELEQPVGDGDDCFVEVPEEQQVQEFTDRSSSKDVTFDVGFPCNGVYELKAFVTYTDPVIGNVGIAPRTELARPSLLFDVAIPPAQVSGLNATYDAASKQARLTWNANPDTEVDLLGYRVERNPPGPSGFEPVGDRVTEPAFTDMDIDAEHRYRVIAVRAGAHGIPIDGAPSSVVAAGPDVPDPVVGTPTPRGTTATRSPGSRPAVRKRTATTVDTGFSRDLPFDPNETTTSQLPATPTEPDGQAALVAEFDDDDDDDGRATLVPIAGGLALLMSAVHMRLLSNRVGQDDIPILPGG